MIAGLWLSYQEWLGFYSFKANSRLSTLLRVEITPLAVCQIKTCHPYTFFVILITAAFISGALVKIKEA
jgi:hypothetical protein